MSVKKNLQSNARKPKGFWGKMMINKMNISHYEMTGWALDNIKINEDSHVLDIGCGGGRTIKRMADNITSGHVSGIDYSDLAVKQSKRKNHRKIKKGIVDIANASVSNIPASDNSYDIVTSFESFYFFPNVDSDIKEIWRVLRPGGKLLICLEIYKDGIHDERNEAFVKQLKLNYYSAQQLKELLCKSGFDNIKIFEEKSNGWVCIIGDKMI